MFLYISWFFQHEVKIDFSQKYSNMQFQFIYIFVWLITFYHWMSSYFVGTPNIINSFTYWKTPYRLPF